MSKAFGHIYVITNKANGKKYVGQTVRGIKVRLTEHLRKSQKQCIALHNAVQKHGESNFSIKVLEGASSREALDKLEIKYIKSTDTLAPKGYNLTTGGSGASGYKHSEEAKRNMSMTRKSGLADGTIPNVWVGRKHTEATKAKFRRPKTESEKLKMSLAKRGKPSNNRARYKTENMQRARKVHTLVASGVSRKFVAKETDLGLAAVCLILSGKRFPNVYREVNPGKTFPPTLTIEQKENRARKAYTLAAEGLSQKNIAQLLGIKASSVSLILSGRHFKNVYVEVHGGQEPKIGNMALKRKRAREVHRLSKENMPNVKIGNTLGMTETNVRYILSGKVFPNIYAEEKKLTGNIS